MQKKKEEIFGFKLFVSTIFKATNEPNKYEPESPKKILAFGKLKIKKEINIIIWPVKKNENLRWSLLKFTNNNIEFIIIKFIVKRPLNPSIKLAPFITNKKHNNTNSEENVWLDIKKDKKGISILKIFIGKKYIETSKRNIIIINLVSGFILILKSSKKPIKNTEQLMII